MWLYLAREAGKCSSLVECLESNECGVVREEENEYYVANNHFKKDVIHIPHNSLTELHLCSFEHLLPPASRPNIH